MLDIGPMLPEAYFTDDVNLHLDEETDPCILWLSTQKPSSVLYVSFGSFTTHGAPQLLELASELEASGQPFLWILRLPDSLPAHEATEASTSLAEYLPPGECFVPSVASVEVSVPLARLELKSDARHTSVTPDAPPGSSDPSSPSYAHWSPHLTVTPMLGIRI